MKRGCSERGNKDSSEVDRIAPDGEPAGTATELQFDGELYCGEEKERSVGRVRKEAAL
jgi:hypothetical protein